jgi:hypothetical protein
VLKPRVRARALEDEGSATVHVVRAPTTTTQEGPLDRGNHIASRVDNLCVACVLVYSASPTTGMPSMSTP